MNIKKQYEEIYAILEANSNKKVSTVLPQLAELMSRKSNSSGQANTFLKDDAGNVIAIYCYYHKTWELLSECEYGKKTGSSTGFNTMCKVGVSAWTKQQRIKKQADSDLLNQVESGDLQLSELGAARQEIIEASKVIIPREDGHGYLEASEAEEVHYNNVNEEL